MTTLVDIILSYDSIPVNAKPSAYKIVYAQLMNEMRNMADEIPCIVDDLPEGSSLQDFENRTMARILFQRKKGEHHSTHIRRVFSLAHIAKSMRNTINESQDNKQ